MLFPKRARWFVFLSQGGFVGPGACNQALQPTQSQAIFPGGVLPRCVRGRGATAAARLSLTVSASPPLLLQAKGECSNEKTALASTRARRELGGFDLGLVLSRHWLGVLLHGTLGANQALQVTMGPSVLPSSGVVSHLVLGAVVP